MLEITIAICPPEGERRVALTGKIENVTPLNTEISDYRCTVEMCGITEVYTINGHIRASGFTSLLEKLFSRLSHDVAGRIG